MSWNEKKKNHFQDLMFLLKDFFAIAIGEISAAVLIVGVVTRNQYELEELELRMEKAILFLCETAYIRGLVVAVYVQTIAFKYIPCFVTAVYLIRSLSYVLWEKLSRN